MSQSVLSARPPVSASQMPTCSADGSEVSRVPLDLLPRAVGIRDWLLEAGTAGDQQQLIAGFAERLNALGVPVDRMTTAIDALHSEYSGIGRIWQTGEGSSFRLFPHGPETEAVYKRSPFALVHETGEWLRLDLSTTPDDAFGIVSELKAASFRHYLVIPLVFTSGTKNGISLATRDPAGYGECALGLLRFLVPTFSAAIEMRSINQRLDNVLRIYVGDEPHRQILSGAIRRGQVSHIRSAILFADMRSYTSITSALSPEQAVSLLNDYFDCLVPAIEEEGGEILKYLGDGLLAIFRDAEEDAGGSAEAALAAASGALRRLDEANDQGRFPAPIRAGIALHHGEAAYGNVGSGNRLDFTVIGRDVNLASRIAQLNKALSEPLLMSHDFSERIVQSPEPLGEHALPGFDRPVAIYRPRGEPSGA